ncbi:penicillin-binding protein activator [Thalassococcus sp. S3]|uniref:penicillin-binding protein activator n=1 Tax=Thalassococcus sp. S3 TaxID=2017482 RepID=UPI0010245449|nr:penicillin-binding protein activator [Thalassococcus sp. S3]QBF33598.1 penicillin-binding protein activator [Thalassococcus sp. S3]
MFAVFRPARKLGLRALALASALALAACEPVALGGGGGPTINTAQPVPVALLVPRGSGQGGDDIVAQSLENAARLAISDLEGVQVDLRVYATAGNAQQAASQAVQAVNDGAKIILGPVYGEAANAAGVAVAGRGINVLSFSNNTTIAGGNVFVLGPTFDNTASRLTRFAASQGKSNILVVHSQDVSGQLGKAAIERAVQGSPARLAGIVPYQRSQQGVVASVPQVRSAVSSSGADAVFLTATTAGALPLFTQLLPEAGVRPENVQYIGLTRWDIPPQTLELPGVQGGWFALPDPGMSARFRSRYQAAYGEPPHPIGGLAYDGIAAIGALVGAGQSNALTGAALTQGAGFQGVNGIFRLRRDGGNERGLAVATIRNRQVVVIDPAPRSFGGPGF